MNELALFAGAGGSILAGELLGWRTIAAVERDAYCVAALLRRQQEGTLPAFPIWDDIRTFDGRPFRGVVDIITAGFPCQPFSVAGKRAGSNDSRNMWPDTARILGEVRPRFALLENVPGLVTSGYFGTVLGDLSALGYDAEWCVLGAHHVGAPHERARLWLLAHTGRLCDAEDEPQQECGGSNQTNACSRGEDVADAYRVNGNGTGARKKRRTESTDGGDVGDADSQRQPQPQGSEPNERGWPSDAGWWTVEPPVGRVAHGVAYRMDRLRALGNGWVPSVAALAWRTLTTRLRAQP